MKIEIKTKHILIGLVVIVAAMSFFFVGGSPTGDAVNTGVVTIPLSEISEQAKWFDYDVSGKTVSFFAVKADDGSIKTAFDACDICYTQKKGYRQEGDQMICNNCGNKYPIDGLGTKNKAGGGCWPGYLPSEVDGENLVIKVSDLENGAYRF